MFKKLKEKIAEEVKPLKISQFAQSVVTPGNNAAVESPPNESFSLDDELPEDSFGNEGFSVVDLHHPSLPVPLSSGRFSRQSSMSSLASDASAFLPIHDASIGTFNMQDLESASEREDVLPQMNNLSKQELCNSYLKLYRHYQKYKGRATDLKNFCRELEKDNKKHKTVLLECQEKSLRRIAELKEQCALEQHAKAHLEEALRNDLEEKDHLIQTLQTKIKLLKDAHAANSSALIRIEDENLLLIAGDIGEDYEGGVSLKDDLQTHQEPLTETLSEVELENSCEKSEIMTLKNRFEDLKTQILKDSNVQIQDLTIKGEFQDLLNEISECLTKKITSPFLSEQKKYSNEVVDKNLQIGENSNLMLLDQLDQNLSESEGHSFGDTLLNFTIAPENMSLKTQNFVHIPGQPNSQEKREPINTDQMSDLPELKHELTELKNKYKKLTHELEESHKLISEQNSTITKLNKELATLQGEFEIYNEKENDEAIKSELMQTKQELERVKQHVASAQQKIDEKDQIIKETKDTLEKSHQELNNVLAQKTEVARQLTTAQSELADTKNSSEELSLKILNAKEETEKKESIIDHLNKEIEKVGKELELAISENNERNEMIRSLENALTETNLKCVQIFKELDEQSKLIEEKDLIVEKITRDLSQLHKDFDMVASEKNEGEKLISTLQTELKDIGVHFEVTTKELQSCQALLKEKDDLINKTKEESIHVHQELDAAFHEKEDAAALLQSQLTDANHQLEKMKQELLSAQQRIDSKECDIVNARANLESVQGDMETVSTRANQTIGALQNEVQESKTQTEVLTQMLHNANESIEKKDNEIVNLRKDLETIKKEMKSVTSQNIEKSNLVKELENDLADAKLQLGKIANEINDFHKLIQEKDLTIASINDELADVRKNLEISLTQKTEVNEIKASLEDKVADMNGCLELLTKDLQSARNLLDEKDSNYAEVCEKLSDIHNELDTVASEKAKAEDKVANLEQELVNMTANFKELTEEHQSSSKLLEDRDFKITCLTEDAASIRETLNKMCSEKEESNEKISSLKKELTTTKLQFEQVSQEMQSTYHVIKEKDLVIEHVTEKLDNMKKDLDIISLQRTEACGLVEDLQDKLKEVSLNFEAVSKEFQEAQESIEKKDLIIANLTTDFTKTMNELTTTSALKDEACEIVTNLQKELENSQLCYHKASEELECVHKLLEEKDLCIEQLNIDLANIQQELNETCVLNSETNKHVETLQSELKEARINLEHISSELTEQFEAEKKLESLVTEKVDDVVEDSTEVEGTSEETSELVMVLKRKLESSEQQLENMVLELQTSQRIIEEREIFIKKLEQELVDIHKKIRISDNDNLHHIYRDTLENPLNFENSGHSFKNNLDNNKIDLCASAISSAGQSCDDKLFNKKCGYESDSKVESDASVTCISDQEQNTSLRQKSSTSGSSCAPDTAGQDNAIVSSHLSVNLSTCASQIANRTEPSLLSENHPVIENISSLEEPSRLSGEGINNLGSSKKPIQSDTELSSWTDADIPVGKKPTSRNTQEALASMGHKNMQLVKELEISSIQNILDEIQKENKEYGSLLDCHKNIINHLEGITKLQAQEIQPGSAEWLHKQLIILSQKLYDTKEKQSVQIASINRLVKHQQDLMKSDDNENMTIEMQYLRNIVFQYMIGKETMLLAKVISAVMKFDQQQMDQVIQKELQKQTLLGQLGLL